MTFVTFVRSPMGRALRVVLGIALIEIGIRQVGGTAGLVVATVGVVPVMAGIFNFCLAGPIFGVDLLGRPRRRSVGR